MSSYNILILRYVIPWWGPHRNTHFGRLRDIFSTTLTVITDPLHLVIIIWYRFLLHACSSTISNNFTIPISNYWCVWLQWHVFLYLCVILTLTKTILFDVWIGSDCADWETDFFFILFRLMTEMTDHIDSNKNEIRTIKFWFFTTLWPDLLFLALLYIYLSIYTHIHVILGSELFIFIFCLSRAHCVPSADSVCSSRSWIRVY